MTENAKKDNQTTIDQIEQIGQKIVDRANLLGMNEAEIETTLWILEQRPSDIAYVFIGMELVHKYKKSVTDLYDNSKRNVFLKALNAHELELFGLDPNLLNDIKDNLSFKEMLELFGLDILALYKKNTSYRTKAKAREIGAITESPNSLMLITAKDYKNATSLNEDGNAYLAPLDAEYVDKYLTYNKGVLYLKNSSLKEVTKAQLQDIRTKENIDKINLVNLRYYYTILASQFMSTRQLNDVVIVSADVLTDIKNPNKKDIARGIENLQAYHNITGVVKSVRNGRERESYYQVLNFEWYDDKTNTFAFSSPYMNYVIKTVYEESIQRYEKNANGHHIGDPIIRKNGKPKTKPSYTFSMNLDIRKERDKIAIETVSILLVFIETCGSGLPNIKLSTIIERNPLLAERLQADQKHRSQTLKRHFSNVWRMLKTKTDIIERYNNFHISTDRLTDGILLEDLDPKDKTYLPSLKDIDTMCFFFPHDGKKETPKMPIKE